MALHGASSGKDDFLVALGDRLRDFRVVSFDRPGHGWSDRIDGRSAARPARQAAILADALHALGIRDAVVVCHSWAGAILPILSLDHRDVVAAALYLAPASHPWPGGRVSWYYGPAGAAWLGPVFNRTVAVPAARALMRSVAAAVFDPQPMPADYLTRARIPLVLRPRTFQANAEDVAELFDAVSAQQPRYRDIRLPTTVIAGDADRIVWTHIHAQGLARDIPGARLVLLPGVGHAPHHAAPDLVAGEIASLAAQVRGRARLPPDGPPAREPGPIAEERAPPPPCRDR